MREPWAWEFDVPLFKEPGCLVCGSRFEKGPTHWVCLGCGMQIQHSSIQHSSIDDVSRLWDAVALWVALSERYQPAQDALDEAFAYYVRRWLR